MIHIRSLTRRGQNRQPTGGPTVGGNLCHQSVHHAEHRHLQPVGIGASSGAAFGSILPGLPKRPSQLSAGDAGYDDGSESVSFIFNFKADVLGNDCVFYHHSILIPALNKDEKAFHECSVVFFTPGRFKADIQCRSLSSNGDVGSTPSTSSSHVWRFIPPVEITVVDE